MSCAHGVQWGLLGCELNFNFPWFDQFPLCYQELSCTMAFTGYHGICGNYNLTGLSSNEWSWVLNKFQRQSRWNTHGIENELSYMAVRIIWLIKVTHFYVPSRKWTRHIVRPSVRHTLVKFLVQVHVLQSTNAIVMILHMWKHLR